MTPVLVEIFDAAQNVSQIATGLFKEFKAKHFMLLHIAILGLLDFSKNLGINWAEFSKFIIILYEEKQLLKLQKLKEKQTEFDFTGNLSQAAKEILEKQ